MIHYSGSKQHFNQKFCDDFKLYNKEWLYDEHVNKKRTLKNIGKELGCNSGTVKYNLKKFGISTNGKAIGHNPNSSKLTREYLIKEYIINKKPYSQIAVESGVNAQTICNYIKKYKIEPRDYIECHLGNANGNWHGGLSFKRYCMKFNAAFKRTIREKFNFRCFLCGALETDTKHSIHHIDYNRNSICNGKEWAFVPLCTSCHMKTNFHRWHWFNLLINYWAYDHDESIFIHMHEPWNFGRIRAMLIKSQFE